MLYDHLLIFSLRYCIYLEINAIDLVKFISEQIRMELYYNNVYSDVQLTESHEI